MEVFGVHTIFSSQRYRLTACGQRSYPPPGTIVQPPPSFTPGDVNDDGRINSMDILLIARYIAGHDLSALTFIREAADVNGDGQINIFDVLLLQRYVAGHDVTLG